MASCAVGDGFSFGYKSYGMNIEHRILNRNSERIPRNLSKRSADPAVGAAGN